MHVVYQLWLASARTLDSIIYDFYVLERKRSFVAKESIHEYETDVHNMPCFMTNLQVY